MGQGFAKSPSWQKGVSTERNYMRKGNRLARSVRKSASPWIAPYAPICTHIHDTRSHLPAPSAESAPLLPAKDSSSHPVRPKREWFRTELDLQFPPDKLGRAALAQAPPPSLLGRRRSSIGVGRGFRRHRAALGAAGAVWRRTGTEAG